MKKKDILVQNSLRKEKIVLITVLFFFLISYLVRFIFDMVGSNLDLSEEYFKFFVFMDLTFFLEVASFLALLSVHFKNFREQESEHGTTRNSGLISDNSVDESIPTASINSVSIIQAEEESEDLKSNAKNICSPDQLNRRKESSYMSN